MAGEATRPRFIHLADHDVRRATFAKLAFDIRLEGADGGIEVGRAKGIVRDYLTTSDRSLDADRARLAAEEMLAVNAESMGLLVEKVAGEIGFAHASFEEHLAATHIQEWALDGVTAFVADHAGDPRWRAVFLTLTVLAARAQEVDLIVAAIEQPQLDAVGDLNRRLLLAGIAFEPAKRSRATTARLLQGAFEEIETGEWPGNRAEVLKAALDGLDDPTVGPSVEARITMWAPRLPEVGATLFDALAGWARPPDLADTLQRSMGDEERPVRRAAARALAKVYGGDPAMLASLMQRLAATSDLGFTAAIVEALYRGWPDEPAVVECLTAAVRSADPTIRFVGATGRVATRRHGDGDKEALVGSSGLDFCDRPLMQTPGMRALPQDTYDALILGGGGLPRTP